MDGWWPAQTGMDENSEKAVVADASGLDPAMRGINS